MCKSAFILVLVLAALSSFSQQNITVFKMVADSVVKRQYPKLDLVSIKCESFTTISSDDSETAYSSYDSFRNVTGNFSEVEFSYSFYSLKIAHHIEFFITVKADKSVENHFSIFDDIPPCFTDSRACNFIQKDSALRIAIHDGVLYPDNLTIIFVKNKTDKKYYWIIDGFPTIVGQKRKPQKFSLQQHRIINASTGAIISWEQFYR